MDLSIVSQDGQIAHLRVKGRVTQKHLAGMSDILVELLGVDVYKSKVLLDMAEAEFLDSSGVSWLLIAHKRFREQGGRFVLYAVPPMVLNVLKILRMQLVFDLAETHDEALQKAQGSSHMTDDAPVEFEELAFGDMPANQALEAIIRKAGEMRASDIHILSEEDSAVVAIRRMGRVEKLATVSRDFGRQLISAGKAGADMDIAERRRPLDGRWVFNEGDVKLDLRINCIPTMHGEDMTCRLLDRRVSLLTVEQLGMTRRDMSALYGMLNSPSGLILVTGPTGTGKTTTMYACLRYLNDGKRKLNTLEDPIEYSLPGVRQSQVQSKLGVHFADLLRNVLRQAPDVIMIGEIRDDETAATAVRAANSGHMVLATLHAPVAAGAVQSMIALGAHRYFLASCLLGVVAQRLMRVLSDSSRIAYDLSAAPETFSEIHGLLEPGQGKVLYGPDHTDEFSQEGYSSRTGLFEVMGMSTELRRLIAEGRPSNEIERAAIANGMIEFRRAALLKVAQGVTSIEEMMRSVPTEHLGLET